MGRSGNGRGCRRYVFRRRGGRMGREGAAHLEVPKMRAGQLAASAKLEGDDLAQPGSHRRETSGGGSEPKAGEGDL